MTLQQALEKHIEECYHRIDNIKSFMDSNLDADVNECADNMISLRMAAEALKVLVDLQNRNMTMEVLKEYMKFEDKCVQKGFTLQKLLEAMEKQEPMITFRKTAAAGRSEFLPKPTAIYLGYSSHDCESRYRCPCCNNNFGSWSVFNNKENENGTNLYCPSCKTELDGLK